MDGFSGPASSRPGHTRAGRRFAKTPSSRRMREQRRLGTLGRRPVVERRIADGAEQDGVGGLGRGERVGRQRR